MPLLSDRVKVVLVAGGRGERFWPKSTRPLPKQFLQVDGYKSLLRKTFERMLPVVDQRSIFVVTGREYEALTRRELPELTTEQLILEPESRNTAPAIGLAAIWLDRLYPDSIFIALPSDHHIVGEAKFHATLAAAACAAEEGRLVTLGVQPTRTETGYGYIRTGSLLKQVAGLPLYRTAGFTEKPDAETAERYWTSGEFLWNSGILVSRTDTLLEELGRYLPEVYDTISQVDRTADTLQELQIQAAAKWATLPTISIDYGILERSQRVVTVPAHFGWTDVGDWAAFGRLLPLDDGGNAVRGEALLRDSRGLLIDADSSRLVVAIGVTDLIVVDTPQALLVCAKEAAQEVRKVTGLATAFTDALIQRQSPEGREVPKPWGREIWWAVTDRYVGKWIEVRAGHSLSLQLHEQKHETLFMLNGTGRLLLGEQWHTVRPGTVFTVPPGTVHRIEAHSDLLIIEVSTPELDDVVRLDDNYGRAVQQ